MSISFVLLAIGTVLAQPQTVEGFLDSLKQTAAPPKEVFSPVSENCKLDQLYNSAGKELAAIESSESPYNEKANVREQTQSLQISTDDQDYVATTCKDALEKNPIDWEVVRRCFFLGQARTNYSTRLVPFAEAVVRFRGVPSIDITTPQIRATLSALSMIADSSWEGRFDFLKECSLGTVWDALKVQSTARPDLRELLQGRAVLCVSKLPIDKARAIIKDLSAQYPPRLFEEKLPNAKLSLNVALIVDDLERREKSLPPLVSGIR